MHSRRRRSTIEQLERDCVTDNRETAKTPVPFFNRSIIRRPHHAGCFLKSPEAPLLYEADLLSGSLYPFERHLL
jgi:hypothetical protein